MVPHMSMGQDTLFTPRIKSQGGQALHPSCIDSKSQVLEGGLEGPPSPCRQRVGPSALGSSQEILQA